MDQGSGFPVRKGKRNRRSERFIKYSSRLVSPVHVRRVCALTVTAQIASDIWPEVATDDGQESGQANESGGTEDDEDFEAQIAKELASIKRPRKEQRFGGFLVTGAFLHSGLKHLEANCQTNTPCGMKIYATR